MVEKIKEQVEKEVEQVTDRDSLNIQGFMDDMRMLDTQLNSKSLAKPVFDYGAPEVTNYLLWIILGELMMLNDKLEGA